MRCASFALGAMLLVVTATPAVAQSKLGAGVTAATSDRYTPMTPFYTSSITRGDVTAVLITLTNSDTDDEIGSPAVLDHYLNNARFTLNLQALGSGLAIVQAPSGPDGVQRFQCFNGDGSAASANGTVTASVASNTISLTNGQIPPAKVNVGDGKCEIVVTVTSVQDGANPVGFAIGAVQAENEALVTQSNPTANSQVFQVASFTLPTLGKSFTPTTVTSGGAVAMTVTIKNNNLTLPLPLNDRNDAIPFALHDALPAGLKFASVATPPTNCGGAEIDATAGGSSVKLVNTLPAGVPSIPAGATCSFVVNLTAEYTTGANGVATITNTIPKSQPVSATGAGFANKRGVAAVSDATANIEIRTGFDVQAEFSRDPVAQGRNSTATITFRNLGGTPIVTNTFSNSLGRVNNNPASPAAATPAIPVDTNGLLIQSAGTTCPSITVTKANNDRDYVVPSFTLGGGATCTVTLTYQGFVTDGAPSQTLYHVLAPGQVVSGGGVTSGGDVAEVNVYRSLLVDKEIVGPSGQLAGGQAVQFRLIIGNYGEDDRVVVTDRLPSGLTILDTVNYQFEGSSDFPGCATSAIAKDYTDPTTPVWTYTTFPKSSDGATDDAVRCALTFWALVPTNLTAGASITNALVPCDIRYGVGAASGHQDPVSGMGFCALRGASVAGVYAPPIAITQNFYQGINPVNSVAEGAVAQLRFTLSNLGASQLENAAFTATLGPGLVVAGPTNGLTYLNDYTLAPNCGTPTITALPGTSTITFQNGTIGQRSGTNGNGPNPGQCIFSINVTAPAGVYDSTLPPSALSGDQRPGGATGTVPTSSSPQQSQQPITFTSLLSASKSFSPQAISSGGRSRVRILLQNGGAATYSNVSVNDPLPPGMLVASAPNPQTTCGGSPTITATAGTGVVTMTGALLPPGVSGVCDLQFDVIATGTDPSWVNTIPINNIQANAGAVKNVSTVFGTLNRVATGSVAVTNSIAPNSITSPGQTRPLIIELANTAPGAVDLTNVSLIDYLTTDGLAPTSSNENGMVIGASPDPQTTCGGGTLSATPGGRQVEISGVSLPAGTSCTFQVQVTLLRAGQADNIIPAGRLQSAEGITNGAPAQTNLLLGAAIGVSKKFDPPVRKPGEVSRLQITIYNLLPSAVDNLVMTDNLPGPVRLASSPNPVTNCQSATLTPASFVGGGATVGITGGHLNAVANSGDPAQSCTVEVSVVSSVEGAHLNTIAAGGVSGTNPTPISNQIPATAILQVRNPIQITKTFDFHRRALGEAARVTIRFVNPNSDPMMAAKLIDNLPTGLAVAPTPDPQTTCGGIVSAPISATIVQLTGATLPVGPLGCQIEFNVVSNVAGEYENIIPAGRLETQFGVTNLAPTSDTVIYEAPPSVTKSFSPPAMPAGETSVLTITLNNPNSEPATLSSIFTDTLPLAPGPITVAGAAGGTCTTASVTATMGSGSVSYAQNAVIPPGGCTITVPVTGASNGVHTNTIAIGALKTSAGANIAPATDTLTISLKGFISGRVFRDNDVVPNGVFGATDAAISGVTVTLTGLSYGADGVLNGGDDAPIAPAVTTTTNALGVYAFYELTPGDYTITESEPGGLLNGITTAGSINQPGFGTPGSATALTVTPSVITHVVLLKNGSQTSGSAGNNFAEVAPSTISGVVFKDLDDNGVQDPGDTVINGVDVELLQGATVLQTIPTSGSGAYSFTNLAAGTYTVREPTQPPATTDGKTVAGSVGNGGAPGTVSTQGTAPSTITGIILPPGTTTGGNNFAELPGGRSISGTVYIDANDNGFVDGSETRLSGVTVNLTGPSTAPAVTDANGNYTFGGLAAGTYTVTEPGQPANTTDGKTTAGSTAGLATAVGALPSSINGINLTGANITSTGNNFGEKATATPGGVAVSGKVYGDANNNGVVDSGEHGIAGVTVTLTGTDSGGNSVSLTTTTDANGDYVFSDVPASGGGGYTITEIQPANPDGVTTAPTGVVSPGKPIATSGSDSITGVVVVGTSLTGYNFGERPGSTISGKVYKDLNDNGVVDAGEDGIPGVTVTLTGTSVTGEAVNLTTTTNSAGDYSFAAPASNAAGYVITETQPAIADGKTTAPGVGSATSAKPVAAGGQDVITGVTLTTNPLSGFNFGELDGAAKVTGYVFGDSNNNGVKEAGEAGVASVTVTLTGTSAAGAPVVLTATTGADGVFVFTNVPPSNAAGYVITETQPTAYADGKTVVTPGQPGTPNSAKAVNVGDQDRVIGVVVPANTNRGDYIFAEVPIPSLKPPIINGYVYLDRSHTRVRPTDGSIEGQAGWTVTLRQNGVLICTTTTTDKGFYQFDNLHCPGYEQIGLPTGPGFSITFDKDGSNLPAVPQSGGNRGLVPPTGGQILNITLSPSDQVVEQNLPLDPAGVVYNSVTRKPVAGAVVVITGPAGFTPETMLVGGLAAQNQTVGSDGLYQFLLQSGFPSGVYTLTVTAPANYMPAPSTSIPVCPGVLVVKLVPDPALLQANDNPPSTSAPNGCPGLQAGGSNTTQYYFQFNITNGGSAPILNNHIPLDPVMTGALFITKTSPMVNVARGDLVPYTITATNTQTTASGEVTVRDQLPAGFKYRDGTATRNGVKVAPVIENGFVTWPAEIFAPKEKKTYSLMLTVGAGVGDGDYVNRAWGSPPGGAPFTNIASATVRIVPDPTFDCPDIIGKVFDDKNANGYQDDGEPGIPAVRLATANGLLITTDSEGRFHVPCPMTPDQDRGSNFVLKLDARSLPSGFRITTENPASIRVTRGKMVKLNFGAAVHRVVRVELSDAAFEPGSTNLKAEFRASLDTMPAALAERPSVVRIAYKTGGDPPDLVKRRTQAVRETIRNAWKAAKGRYALDVEIEGEQQ